MHLLTILNAMADARPCTIVYRAANGIVSLRTITAYAVRHCANGNTIVSAFDHHRQEPRSFTMRAVLDAAPGSLA